MPLVHTCVDMPLPPRVTPAARDFFQSARATIGVVSLVIHSVTRVDDLEEVIRCATGGLKILEPGEEVPRIFRARFAEHGQVFTEMVVCKFLDNFSTYLVEVIETILRIRPELLRSNAQIRLDEAFSFDNMDDLRNHVIQRRVEELGYMGFVDLERWWQDRLGVPLVSDAATRQSIVELIETRNCIVHARARIGKRYVERCPGTTRALGTLRKLEAADVDLAHELMIEIVGGIDPVLVGKFGVDTVDNPIPKYTKQVPPLKPSGAIDPVGA